LGKLVGCDVVHLKLASPMILVSLTFISVVCRINVRHSLIVRVRILYGTSTNWSLINHLLKTFCGNANKYCTTPVIHVALTRADIHSFQNSNVSSDLKYDVVHNIMVDVRNIMMCSIYSPSTPCRSGPRMQ
jgi:hypothetical protein